MFFNSDRMSFQVLSVANIRHPNGVFSVPPRPYAAISLRRAGQGVFRVGGAAFTAKAGDVTFLPAHIGYEVDYLGSEIDVIHLSDCAYVNPENIRFRHPDYISRLFRQILTQWEADLSANALKSSVYHLLAVMEEDNFSNINEAFHKCSLYMQEHFTDDALRIADVCRAGGLSEAGLYRQFMAFYGIPPKQYLLKLRLNCAMELLLRSNAPIPEIARLSGFQDAKYFSRMFKKWVGIPPSQYRRS